MHYCGSWCHPIRRGCTTSQGTWVQTPLTCSRILVNRWSIHHMLFYPGLNPCNSFYKLDLKVFTWKYWCIHESLGKPTTMAWCGPILNGPIRGIPRASWTLFGCASIGGPLKSVASSSPFMSLSWDAMRGGNEHDIALCTCNAVLWDVATRSTIMGVS